jgi:hypothetical protein
MSIKTPNTKINLINNRIKYGTDGGINVDSNALFVNATTGRVGINTTAPTTLLDISGSIKSSGISDYSNSTGNNTQILTNVNGQNIWSYSGYNFNGSNITPSNTLDISSIVITAEGNKYWGGCLAPNGNIYCIPWAGTNVGIINPINDTIDRTTITNVLPASNKYIGGTCAPNGNIYCMRGGNNINNIGVINTNTNTFSTLNLPYSVGDFAYAGSVLATNGLIYGIPYSDSRVMIINPINNDISSFDTLQNSTFKWGGGVLAPNGKIYCIPANFSRVGIIDTANNTIDITSINLGSAGNYFGGVLAPNGRIYCIPRSATNVGIIDPSNNTIDRTTISSATYPFLSTSDKYMGGVLGMDGKIYCIPWGNSTTNVGIIDPLTNTFNSISISAPAGANKYTGGVLAPNGKIYCPPHTASNIGIIKTNYPSLEPWMIAPEFNKL